MRGRAVRIVGGLGLVFAAVGVLELNWLLVAIGAAWIAAAAILWWWRARRGRIQRPAGEPVQEGLVGGPNAA